MIGDPVEFEFTSVDATTAAAISIREPGTPTLRVLGDGERLIILSVTSFIADAVVDAAIFNDVSDTGLVAAGELMYRTGPGNNSVEFLGGMAAEKGGTPKVLSAVAGQVTFTGTGVIINS